jgi:hypothetical protein
MQRRAKEETGDKTRLKMFFEETTVMPFKAVFDWRQGINDIIVETPWLQLSVGFIAGIFIDKKCKSGAWQPDARAALKINKSHPL